MATIDDTVGKLARVYDSQTDTWIPLVGSPVPHVHNVSSSPDVDITEPLIDNEILAYSTSASAFVNTDSPTFDVATIDTANIDVANIIQPSTTVKPLIIRSTAPQTAAVTAATASSGSVTYAITSAETIFTAGDLVTISGINPSSLDDVRATVGSVSSGSVVIFSGKQGTYVSGGTATRIHANLLEIQNSAGTPTSTIRSDGSVTGELTGGLVHIDTVTYDGVSAFSLPPNIFTADYSFYKAIGQHKVNGSYQLRLRAGSTDNSTAASYEREHILGDANSVTASFLADNSFTIGLGRAAPENITSFELTFLKPFETQFTHIFHHSNRNKTNMQFYTGSCIHNQNLSFDSFTLIGGGNNFTEGKISIFGYRE